MRPSGSPGDLEHLFIDMQRLCEAVEADNTQLEALLSQLELMQQRSAQLDEFYQQRWLHGSEQLARDTAAMQRLQDLPASGHYSILGQDTIWDALSERQELIKTLLKHLAKAL